MPSTHTTIVDPDALSPDDRQAFSRELYEAHGRIFAGVSFEAFERYVVAPSAVRRRIQVHRDHEGRIVGYVVLNVFEAEVEGKPCAVIRGAAGFLPEYRGRTLVGGFFVRESLLTRLGYPGRPLYGLMCATHPATYRMFSRYACEVWPHWEKPTPPGLGALMKGLAARFGLEPAKSGREGVYHIGWQTLQDETDQAFWQTDSDPATRFYVDHNPGYTEGEGFLILVPFSAELWFRGIGRLISRRITRARARRASMGDPRDSARANT
ncbi:MAG: hypothetical protein R3B70_01980 [Polyangiaceae bacterium]